MASTISLYMSQDHISARISQEIQDRGFVYDIKLRRSTTELFEVPPGSRLILQVPVDKFHSLLDQGGRLDHYLSLVNDPTQVFSNSRGRVTISLPTVPDGRLILTSLPPDGRRTLFAQVQEISYDRIEDVRFIVIEKERAADNSQASTKEQMLAMAQAMSPDANFYANGMPKDRSRYPPQISQPIPASAIFQDAAADSYLAVIPSPLTAANPLVALDPPIAAAFLSSLPSEAIDETLNTLIATVDKYFDVYASQEKLQSEASTFQWWKKALKVMQAGYRSLGVIIILAQKRDRIEFDLVRDVVYAIRNHLGIMFRRTGKEPCKPSSLESDCPAWWHREHEEFKKNKPKKGESEGEQGRRGRGTRWDRRGNRGRGTVGARPFREEDRQGNETIEAPVQGPKENEEEPPLKKKRLGRRKAILDKATGNWRDTGK